MAIYHKFDRILQYYHFRSWLHHIHQHNYKCNHLFGQCNSHRFGKGLRNIRHYLQNSVIRSVLYGIYFFKLMYQNVRHNIDNQFENILQYYQFHSLFLHIHQRNNKCNHLSGQYSFHRFDRGSWHIHRYLKSIRIRVVRY